MLKSLSLSLFCLYFASSVVSADPLVYSNCLEAKRKELVSSCLAKIKGPTTANLDPYKKCSSAGLPQKDIDYCRRQALLGEEVTVQKPSFNALLEDTGPEGVTLSNNLRNDSFGGTGSVTPVKAAIIPKPIPKPTQTTKATTSAQQPTKATATNTTKATTTSQASSSSSKSTASSSPGTDSSGSSDSSSGGSSGDSAQDKDNNTYSEIQTDRTYPGVDSYAAQAAANQDIAACTQQRSYANTCCNNPSACAGNMSNSNIAAYQELQRLTREGPSAGGLGSYCQQLKSLSAQSGSVNAGLGGVCAQNQSACTSACAGMANKYRGFLYSCNGCDAHYVYQTALNTLEGLASSCRNMQARADTLSQSSYGTGGNEAYSRYCESNVGGTAGTGNSMVDLSKAFGCDVNPASYNCKTCMNNQNQPHCQQLIAAAASAQAASDKADSKGEGGFSNPEKGPKGDEYFNLPNIGDVTTAGFEAGYKFDSQPPTVNGVPNNSGGAIPGGASGGGAKLAAKSGFQKASDKLDGSNTDIQQGFQAGGGYNPASSGGGSGLEGDGSGGSRVGRWNGGRGLASGTDGDGAGYMGMDLRKYLPGGSRDPNRIAGTTGSPSQIRAKEENLWRVISTKIEEKCRLKVLWDCQ